MPVYVRKVATTNQMFQDRATIIATPGDNAEIEVERIPVPDSIVVCNGCNHNLFPDDGYLVYLGKRELKANHAYNIYCGGCLRKYFPKVVMVDG